MELLKPSPSHPRGSAGDGFSGHSPPASLLRSSPSVASEVPEIVEEAGGTVHVAVGTSKEKLAGLLHWTLQRFGSVEVCLLHVHQPSPVIPTLLGKLPASRANPKVVSAHRRTERELVEAHLSSCLEMCSIKKVKASYIMVEADRVYSGIVDLVNKHKIRKLVMGGKCKKVIKKSNHAAKYVPPFCEIWFINKEKHVWTREASVDVSSLPAVVQPENVTAETINSNSLQDQNGEPLLPLKCLQSTNRVQDKAVHADVFCETSRSCFGSVSTSGYGYPLSFEKKSPTLFESDLNVGETNLCFQLQDTSTEAKLRDEVVDVQLTCIKLESDAMEAINMVRDYKLALAREIKLKNEVEEALQISIQEQEKLMEERELVTKELQKTMKNVAFLDRCVDEDKLRCEESTGELKLIAASISTLQSEKRNFQQQKMEAAHWLEQWKSRGKVGPTCYDWVHGVVHDSPKLAEFSLSDLEAATSKFSESLRIGQGGYGCVYRGKMLNRTVAVKKLHPHPRSLQALSEFQQEVQILGKLQHPHLVTLVGACPEAWSLVYDYLPGGSLQDHLFRGKGDMSCLTWQIRTQIIAEISSALLFLHSSKPEPIIHGNLTPDNILFNSELSCKISDFGICRLVSKNIFCCPDSHCKDASPYTDPECDRTGILTPKSDVFSFGIIILQLLTGRSPVGLKREAHKVVSCGNFASILDSSAGPWPTSVVRRLLDLGLECCALNGRDRPELRPTLVTELGQLHILEERPVPSFFLCPILKEIMHDPQIAADGFSYEGEALRGWLENGRKTSPMTNLNLSHLHVTPNHALRLAIQEWPCKT